MPHHPSEEEAPEGIYEKVAKDPSSVTETTASDHEGHHNEHAPDASGKASAQDFQSKGPQIPMNMDGTLMVHMLRLLTHIYLLRLAAQRRHQRRTQGKSCGIEQGIGSMATSHGHA